MDSDKLKTAIDKCFARRETEFDLDKISGIFSNSDYVNLLEKAAKKNFANLDLPYVSEMMSKIKEFVANI
jgi:hypothetical protein